LNERLSIPRDSWSGVWVVAQREIRDQFRDWRITTPIIILTLFFPVLMNITARIAVDFVSRYGAPIIGERLIPFLLLVVGFFPISVSLVIALESFAGERERLSLEPLLATPLSDGQLYLGKMIASVATPLAAAYFGITVYLVGLTITIGWTPEPQLLVQILALTTVQAIVMVCGAVVISSQTTSVRAANLLASFIIIPVAQLVILESMIMFWGRYSVLWWIALGLSIVAVVLTRMGLRLFNREELLGRELDALDLKWVRTQFRDYFISGSTSLLDWYRGLFKKSIKGSWKPIVFTALVLSSGLIIGVVLATQYTLPSEIFSISTSQADLESTLRQFGMFSSEGVWKIFFTNMRALALATLLGAFTFGVLSLVVLMAPLIIIGYIFGNLFLAGADAMTYMLALVVPHAIFEVPAAVLAGAAILQLGMAAISQPKGASLGEGWMRALAEWTRIMIGIVVPLMIVAAIVEVFVTPYLALRLLFGP
jgi:uncharacterized membrane protein SpoIIM required for sporulation/ABC-type transport system involved in multi-copper enzyme maturation permease subunit